MALAAGQFTQKNIIWGFALAQMVNQWIKDIKVTSSNHWDSQTFLSLSSFLLEIDKKGRGVKSSSRNDWKLWNSKVSLAFFLITLKFNSVGRWKFDKFWNNLQFTSLSTIVRVQKKTQTFYQGLVPLEFFGFLFSDQKIEPVTARWGAQLLPLCQPSFYLCLLTPPHED